MEKKKVLLLALALPLSYIPGHTATLCSQIENSSYSLHQTTIQSAQMINPTTAEILFSDTTRLTVDFYGENIFRLFKDNSGGIVRNPQAVPEARILTDNPRKPTGRIILTSEGNEISLMTSQIKLIFNRDNACLKIIRLSDNQTITETTGPIQITDKRASICLKEQADEYFYGGGVQNGRFSHKG